MGKEIQGDRRVHLYTYSNGSCCFAPWKIGPSVQFSHKADSWGNEKYQKGNPLKNA